MKYFGFYGHSLASWSGDKRSFIDKLANEHDADIVNIGAPQGSEERILFELKKTKKLDVAFIFHSLPKYIFLPKCERDVCINSVPENKAKWFWSESNKEVTRQEFEHEFMSYGRIKEVFGSPEEYQEAMTLYKEYFYHSDLMMNRYYSTVMMIDDYLYNRGIKCFHSIEKKFYPKWLRIKSGHVDHTLTSMKDDSGNPNNVSDQLNHAIFIILNKWLCGQK